MTKGLKLKVRNFWGPFKKFDHTLTVAKSKCIWNTHKKNETIKIICTFDIYKTMYHNGKNENDKVMSFI